MRALSLGHIGGIPLNVSPWFFVLAIYTGLGLGSWELTVVWMLCLAVSVVVHELGHAFVAARLRLRPSIVLHGLGGLCAHDPAERDRDEVMIVAAGPLAGYVLAGVAYLLSRGLQAGDSAALDSPIFGSMLHWLIVVNLALSTLNLLPIWPLDGGRLFRLLMLRLTRPMRAERITHIGGIALAIAGAGVALATGFGRLAAFIAVLLAWANYQVLRGEARSGAVRSRHTGARSRMKEAEAAFAAQDFAEAARLCHQVRDTPKLPSALLDRTWHILGVSTARLGRPREAISFLKRAPMTPEVGEEWLRALLELGDTEAAETLVESGAWGTLGTAGERIVTRYAA